MALTGYDFRDGMDAADRTSRNRDRISCRHSRRQPAAPTAGRSPDLLPQRRLAQQGNARSCMM
jgi:hypothetical protein